ncbi:MAG: hypothetical protein ACE5HL_05905 [Terriglobia bacterium]
MTAEKKARERITVGVEEPTLRNSLEVTALVALLEEKGVLKQSDVLDRMKEIRDRKKRS